MSEDAPVMQLTFIDKVRANKEVIIKRTLVVGAVAAGIAITGAIFANRERPYDDDYEDLEPVGEDVNVSVDGTVSPTE